MSYKKPSVVKEVLQHLDESLLPPELLAVPDRKKDGTKISGASTRLYNQQALLEKHKRDLEVKQKEQERLAKPRYDAEHDKHLQQYWKKKQRSRKRDSKSRNKEEGGSKINVIVCARSFLIRQN